MVRARAAVAWFTVVIVLSFAALFRPMQPGALNWLHFVIGIGAAIGITRLWNLLDDARELRKLEGSAANAPTPPVPIPTMFPPSSATKFHDEPYRTDAQ
jgi:hypothetical protein